MEFEILGPALGKLPLGNSVVFGLGFSSRVNN